jgi:hypothetical protein
MSNSPRPIAVAVVALLIAVAGFLQFTINTPYTYTSPISVIYAEVVPPYLPSGPTVQITIFTPNFGKPITHLAAMMSLSSSLNFWTGGSETIHWQRDLDFPNVTQTNPIMPGGWASEKIYIVGPLGLDSNITLFGILADGTKFSLETNLTWVD